MASKFSSFKGKFPNLQLNEHDSSDQRVLKLKSALDGVDHSELENRLLEIREERDALAQRFKENGEEKQALEMALLEWADREGITNWKNDAGYGFRDEPRPFAKVIDHEKFDAWAEQHEWADLYTINSSTLNANVSQLMLENQPLPEGVDVFMKNKIVVTRPR